MRNNHIAILMATYNGGFYLREQIESLLSQTYQDWHLYIHDDGSQDDTVSIIKSFVEQHPNQMTLLDYPPQGGPCRNFLSMLDHVVAQYYMFCDQDDIWLPEKIALSLQKMQECESHHPEQGIVIYTDLQIVDEHLKVIHPSMWKYAGVYPEFLTTFNEAGGHTAIATGCTMLFNEKAKACCSYDASKAVMHDNWVCLCVLKQRGILQTINKPLVLYRQHGRNFFGSGNIAASNITLKYRMTHLSKIYHSNKDYYSMLSSIGYGSFLKYLYAKVKYKIRHCRHHHPVQPQ